MSNAEPADTWVIIPSYNDGEPLGDVLAQLAPFRYSVVVVDDGSPVVLSSFQSCDEEPPLPFLRLDAE